jgi:hypothetical protein
MQHNTNEMRANQSAFTCALRGSQIVSQQTNAKMPKAIPSAVAIRLATPRGTMVTPQRFNPAASLARKQKGSFCSCLIIGMMRGLIARSDARRAHVPAAVAQPQAS